MWLVLLTSWIPTSPLFCPEPLELVEYFSGSARISKWAHHQGYQCRAFDVDYDQPPIGMESKRTGRQKRSAYDMNGEAGFVPLGINFQDFGLESKQDGWALDG